MATEQEAARGEGRVRPSVAYEPSDVQPRRIVWGAAAFLAGTLLASVLVGLPFFAFRAHRAKVSPPASPQAPSALRLPPDPRIQVSPELDLEGYNAGYRKALSSYSWVDKSRGIAAIPIERALRIAEERGIPRVRSSAPVDVSQPRQGDPRTGTEGVAAPLR